ncbi:MAG TPA: GNAT family N-acetyltransferase [Xanthobacteraceae bacterium]|jgi:GNAT superfamily N-acetyltransferase
MHDFHALPQEGLIRKMWRVEASRYRDHLLRLDEDSRRCRFGGAVSDEYVIRHAELALSADTVIHGFFVNGTIRGAAELRAIGSPLLRQAEAALSIEKSWQDRGIGSALLARTLLAARKRGIKFLHMACLADNHRMQKLARKFDAQLKFDFGTAVGAMRAPRLTPLSFMREAFADSHRLARAILDVQAQMLSLA